MPQSVHNMKSFVATADGWTEEDQVGALPNLLRARVFYVVYEIPSVCSNYFPDMVLVMSQIDACSLSRAVSVFH
jgi:hypothetical protein